MSSSRRHFLRSALVLPSALAASAYAQDTKNTPPVSFADFENGWDDWTVEGLAFDTRPATNALFPGKISGFGGRGFVCTLHPRKGNAATGKAVSREFTIEKPFITFKIGGGNFPGAACLNLVIDGKIERTATGDGTATLSEKSWDVSALVGKKAHLEIIDDTVSDQRGYVLVDDINFTERPLMRSQKILEQMGIQPFFIQHTPFFRNDDERLNGRWLPVGLSEAEFENAINQTSTTIYRSIHLAHDPNRTIEHIAALIGQEVNNVVASLGVNKPNRLLQQWLQAEAVCAWVQANVSYDNVLANASFKEQVEMGKTENILKMAQPATICSGKTRIVCDLARAIGRDNGMDCRYVGGWARVNGAAPDDSNHAWNCFLFTDGIHVPADTTASAISLVAAKRAKGKVKPVFTLPKTREDLELFFANRFGYAKSYGEDYKFYDIKMVPDSLSELTWSEWSSKNSLYLDRLLQIRAT